jgi:hypothetical protein
MKIGATIVMINLKAYMSFYLYFPPLLSALHEIPCMTYAHNSINPLMLELNPSTQRCLVRIFTGDFASWTVHFINICVKNQQMQQLFIQFINYVW